MTIYVVANTGVLAVTEDAGRFEVSPLLVDYRIQCIALDPHNPSTLYAGTRGIGLMISDDGGRSWNTTNMPARHVYSVAVSPVDGSVYAGCEPSMIYKSVDEGVSWRELDAFRRLPSAPTWSFPPRPWTSHVRAIAPHPTIAERVLAGVELGGLMFTDDGGRSWKDHRPGAQRDVHAVAWHARDASRAYQAGGGGAAWSRDGAETWIPADEGRDRHYTWALAVHPDDPDTWFVSASPGPSNAHSEDNAQAYVYRRRGDGPWHAVGEGLPQPLDSMPYVLLCGTAYLVAGLRNGQVYVSNDQGDSWQEVPGLREPLEGMRAAMSLEV